VDFGAIRVVHLWILELSTPQELARASLSTRPSWSPSGGYGSNFRTSQAGRGPLRVDAVEKVGGALRGRNNRIIGDDFLNRSCAFGDRLQSILFGDSPSRSSFNSSGQGRPSRPRPLTVRLSPDCGHIAASQRTAGVGQEPTHGASASAPCRRTFRADRTSFRCPSTYRILQPA
jgi:hypothetical protein